MKKLLLTAFGSFPGVESNPSTTVLQQFVVVTRPPCGWTFSTAYLPVSYAYCRKWVRQALPSGHYDAVLHLGVAPGADGFRLEKYGHKGCDRQSKDADGLCWETDMIDSRAPERIPSSLPVEDIVAVLKKQNLPVSMSEDAGGYLCNFLLFQSLWCAHDHAPHTMVGFLHVPLLGGDTSPPAGNPLDLHLRVIKSIVLETIRHVRNRHRGKHWSVPSPTPTR
jgi:pyroglutamyl-peptidase